MPNFTGFSAVPQLVAKVTVDPDQVAGASVGAQSLTVPGSTPDMHFLVTAPSLETNLAVGGAYCTTAGTVVVRIVNPTANPINPASQTFYILGL